MLISFMAMAPGGGGASGGGGFVAFLPMILIIVIMYFLILRPQAKKQKEHQSMLNEVQKGDKIVTGGGIHGTVRNVNEERKTLIVKIADNVKIEIDRGSIGRKISLDSKAIKPK